MDEDLHVKESLCVCVYEGVGLCLHTNMPIYVDTGSQPDARSHVARSKWYHTAEMQVGLETDPSEMLNEIIRTTRKGGIVSDVGCALEKPTGSDMAVRLPRPAC